MAITFNGNDNWTTSSTRNYDQVGSYAFAHDGFTTRNTLPGQTLAGSNLKPAAWQNINWGVTSGQTNVVQEDANQSTLTGWNPDTLSGTYMCMGNGRAYSQTSNSGYSLNATLWIRIS